MSIRLRLTLLYSAILTLTLFIFGVALYSIQAQDTFNALKQDLIMGSERLVEAVIRGASEPHPPDRNHLHQSHLVSFPESRLFRICANVKLYASWMQMES
jgi:hypothetical protein